MRVLLFGANGYLGASLARALHEAGDDVTAIVRPGHGLEAGPGSRTLEVDLAALGKPEDPGPHDTAVFAAQSRAYRAGPEGWPDVVGVNVLGASLALDMARRAGVRRFVYLSSASVYGLGPKPFTETDPLEPPDVYAASKGMAEELVERASECFEVVRLRLFALYGPGQEGRLVPNLIGRVARGEAVTLQPRITGEREPAGFTSSLCHVDDAVAAVRQMLDSDFQGVLNLAAPGAVSVREIAERAGALLRRAPRFEVSEQPRAGDLLADLSRASSVWTGRFRTFSEGIAEIVARESD